MRPLGPRRMKGKKRGRRGFGPAPMYGHASPRDSVEQTPEEARSSNLNPSASVSGESHMALSGNISNSNTHMSSALLASSQAGRTKGTGETYSASTAAPQAFLSQNVATSHIAKRHVFMQETSMSSVSRSHTLDSSESHKTSDMTNATAIPSHSAGDYMRVYIFSSHNNRQINDEPQSLGICLALKSQKNLVYSQWENGISKASAHTFNDEYSSGMEVSVCLLGPLFETMSDAASKSRIAISKSMLEKCSSLGKMTTKNNPSNKKKSGYVIKFWWVEGRPCWKTLSIETPQPSIQFDLPCCALVTRQGEAYCQRIFHMAFQRKHLSNGTSMNTQTSCNLVITSASEDVFPFSLHRDCDVPVRPRSFDPRPGDMDFHTHGDDRRLTSFDLQYADECAKLFERPCGKYALIIASDKSSSGIGRNVANAIQLEQTLQKLGYAITRIFGKAATDENVLTALNTMMRPPEPPSRGMGRGGWWAGGSSSASALVFISLENTSEMSDGVELSHLMTKRQSTSYPSGLKCANGKVLNFQQVRKALILGGRAQRPLYLQGYGQMKSGAKIRRQPHSRSARILCIIDGTLDASEDAQLRGHQTLVQDGVYAQKPECNQPMESSDVASVQMLLMPHLAANSNGDMIPNVEKLHANSLYVSILVDALEKKIFRKTTKWKKPNEKVDSVSAGMLVEYLELEAMAHTRNQSPKVSPKLFHLYPGTISHPDVTNRLLQFYFQRSSAHQYRVERARYVRVLKNNFRNRKLQIESSAQHLEFLNKKYDQEIVVKRELERSLSKLRISVSPVNISRSKSAASVQSLSPRSRKLLFKYSRNRPPKQGVTPGRRRGPLKRTAFVSDINGRRIAHPRRPRSAFRVRRRSMTENRPSSAHINRNR